MNFQMFKLVLEKAEEPEIKLPTSAGSSKKQKSSRKTSISALMTMPKPLTVDHNKLRKILKEMGIQDHLTCLLRNLYAGQEATVRTEHGATDWFQIGKRICQGCIFNIYAEYIMRNAGMEEAKEFQKNIYFCFIDYAKAFDCVDHNKLWKILKEMEIPDHLTCLLKNLFAGQEATIRTGHGTTDWF